MPQAMKAALPGISSTAELRRRFAAMGSKSAPRQDFRGAVSDPTPDVGADVQHYAGGTTNVRMLFGKVNPRTCPECTQREATSHGV